MFERCHLLFEDGNVDAWRVSMFFLDFSKRGTIFSYSDSLHLLGFCQHWLLKHEKVSKSNVVSLSSESPESFDVDVNDSETEDSPLL